MPTVVIAEHIVVLKLFLNVLIDGRVFSPSDWRARP